MLWQHTSICSVECNTEFGVYNPCFKKDIRPVDRTLIESSHRKVECPTSVATWSLVTTMFKWRGIWQAGKSDINIPPALNSFKITKAGTCFRTHYPRPFHTIHIGVAVTWSATVCASWTSDDPISRHSERSLSAIFTHIVNLLPRVIYEVDMSNVAADIVLRSTNAWKISRRDE